MRANAVCLCVGKCDTVRGWHECESANAGLFRIFIEANNKAIIAVERERGREKEKERVACVLSRARTPQ